MPENRHLSCYAKKMPKNWHTYCYAKSMPKNWHDLCFARSMPKRIGTILAKEEKNRKKIKSEKKTETNSCEVTRTFWFF